MKCLFARLYLQHVEARRYSEEEEEETTVTSLLETLWFTHRNVTFVGLPFACGVRSQCDAVISSGVKQL